MKFDIENIWKEYAKLIKERPEDFINSEHKIIVSDEIAVKKFYKETGKIVGLIYKSEFNIFIVDLIQSDDGSLYTYERILPTVKISAIVVIPIYKGKFILLNQYRHALRDYQISFPRGYGEINLDDEQNARKELKEELDSDVEKIVKIGTVVADSGLSGMNVSVFASTISKPKLKYNFEGIQDILELTQEELDEMIVAGMITDGFTLSAYSLYCCIKSSRGVKGHNLMEISKF